jgi:adenylate cyclase
MSRFGLKLTEERLWDLVAQRGVPGADQAALEKRVWDLFGERWAIVFTDLAGFSRRVEAFGILHFLQTIYDHKRLLQPVIHDHDGVLIKADADSMMLLFRSTENAWRCCVAMQQCVQRHSAGLPEQEQILLCAGIGYGDIIKVGDDDVFGQQVNAAAKLGEDTAKAHEILLTHAAYEQLKVQPGFSADAVRVDVLGTGQAYQGNYQRGA